MADGGVNAYFDKLRSLTLKLKMSRPNITIFFTLLAVGVAFAWLGVKDPSQWRTGVALYILGCKSQLLRRNYTGLMIYRTL